MKRFIKNCMLDNSDEQEFRFSAVCTDCGEEYRSTPVLFSKYALPPPTEEKRIILRRLYEREHEQALQQAVSDAVSHFNVCPICGRLVCNNCFVILGFSCHNGQRSYRNDNAAALIEVIDLLKV